METKYQQCTRCVMDTTDPEIQFDQLGVCSHCHKFDQVTRHRWYPNEEGRHRLEAMLQEIRSSGKGARYDCVLGLSGGVDSSYLALRAYDWNLKPLVVHVDAGWNSELAVANIEAIVKYCGYHLHTHVIDWQEMRDLQLAYLRAGVANQDVPQDHAFFATLYKFAVENGIRYVLSGGNIATEGVFPQSWQASAMDSINLRAIHRRFGSQPLRSYRTISFFEYYLWYPMVRRLRVLRPLNYLPYNKRNAEAELQAIGWRPYAKKHGESIFTKFFQNYYLPKRFGYDKRKPHLSSLILSGQMDRVKALEALEEPLYSEEELESDIAYFCKKLRIDRALFEELMGAPLRKYTEFPSWIPLYRALKLAQPIVERITGRRLHAYS